MILHAWLTLPSCLASSSRPALARMTFWSLVMTVSPGAAVTGAAQPRPAPPPPRLEVRVRKDTVRQIKLQLSRFISGSLRQLVPDDHVLARVDRVLDLTWLRAEVAECYCPEEGRPGIDPEVAVRLMLAGLLVGMVHDRKLMREATVNIAIRWFVGYGLHEKLPHHSSLTRIRQRWGEERFRRIFQRTVEACLKAKIATAEVVHIDASLIRANVSWESLVERHATEVLRENETEDEIEAEKTGRQSGKYKKVSL